MKRTLLIAIGYFLVAEISIALSMSNASTAIVWPAAGVAFAVILRFGPAIWPAIALGSLLANAHFLKGYEPSLVTWITANIGIAIGNIAAPLAGIRLINFYPETRFCFSRHKDVLTFVLLGTIPLAVIAALGGAVSIHGTGLGGNSDFFTDWQQWGISDLVGALIVSPALLMWLQDHSVSLKPKKAMEAACITVVIIFMAAAVFGPLNNHLNPALARPFLIILPLIWAAVRFSPRATASWNLLAFIIIWIGASYGFGQYNRESLPEPMVPVQLFLGIVGFTILLLCSVVQELKQARLELLEANAGLEERVLERTQELRESEQLLREAKEKAEKATELKDKFVSLVSHDLRSPLGSVVSILEMLDGPNKIDMNEEEREKITHSAKNLASRQLKMVDTLLDVSRFQAGKIVPVNASIDLKELVCRQIDNFSYLAGKKGIEFLNELPEGLKIMTDEALLGEVMQNLLSNAVKFCGNGGKITLYAPDGSGSCLAIKDTGVGIRSELTPHLFQYELKTTSRGTDGEKGMGLGLPYCNDIMRALGGTISVESTEGEGATFTLYFTSATDQASAGE